MGAVLSVIVAVGVPLGAGFGIGLAIQHDVKGWYKRIKKPSWNPPNWIFGPVWSALYTAMGVASWKVWSMGGGAVPLTLYAVQLALNLAWSPLFFAKHEIGFALADITALLGVLAATIVKFHEVSPTSAYLMVPYFGWTAFAAALTYDIYKNNPRERGALDFGRVAAEGADEVKKAGAAVKDAAATAAEKAKELVPKLNLENKGKAAEGAAGDAKKGAEGAGADLKKGAEDLKAKAA